MRKFSFAVMAVILLMSGWSYAPSLQAAETEGSAVITTSGVTSTLAPNAEGVFPKVSMAANGSATVTVTFAAGASGDKVAIAAMDGGSVDGRVVQVGILNDKLQVSFTFATTANDGIYRVELRNAQGTQTLQFWVGSEPPLKS